MTCSRMLMIVLMTAAVCIAGADVGAAEEVNVTFEGHFGGVTYATAVSGNYAYVGQEQHLVVLDVSNPSQPLELGRIHTLDIVYDIKISGSYAYVADWDNGLVIIDISDPAAPSLAGRYDTAGYACGVAVSGSYAYVADHDNGLVIVDISNPAATTFAGSYNTAGSAFGVAVSGSYAYVADYTNGLVIIDISNPTAPTLAGSYDTGDAWGVAVSGSYAYVADYPNGLVIIDISNPTAPTFAGSYDTAGWAYGVAVSGSYAYVADLIKGLVIVDISNPAAPTLTGSYYTAVDAHGIAVSGSYAYVADYDNGLVIVDISNPATPTLAGSYNTAGYARGVTVSGSYAYVANYDKGLVIIDISKPPAPTLAGSYDTGDAWGVAVSGSYAYVADGANGLVIVDISNPAAPTFAGSYYTAGYARSVAVSGSYAYVADSSNGLVFIDISNPAAPTLVGSYDTAGYAYGVAVSGSHAYIADRDNGLVIIDISNLAAPTLAGSYDTAGEAYGVTVSGSYAYVADYDKGLVIVDINNPAAPTLAGSYDTAGWAYGVAVSGSYAYVADLIKGLVIVDISNPTAPALAGSYDTAGWAYDVAVSGSYVYVADYTNGLVILRMDASGTIPPEITRSRLGINAHWNHWAEDLSVYKQKTISFGIVRDQAWWAGLETSDLTGSEWASANWNYFYDTETLCGKEITYQSGLDNLVKLYQDEDSPELLLLLNLKNDNISSFETITADQYYDYVYHVVERYDGDGLDDMPGLIRPVNYFEVGNEVDYIRTNDSRHGYLSPKDYVEKRLIPAYNAAKAANKDAVIMGSGLGMESDLSGGKTGEFNTAYLEAMYDNITDNGGSKNNNFYMDKIAIHYYSQNEHPELFDENIKQVENVIMDKEGSEKPIWITEFAPASPPSLYARLLTLMFANRIEMPMIYNLKDDSKESFGLYNVTCEGDEETITPRESIQVIDTVLSTLHGTTPSETENEDISIEPGKTTYKRVFNNSDKKVTVLWYIDTADPGAITNYEVSPESPQTFTVDVLGTANFSHTSPIHLEIGYEPTYVVEADLPIDVDLYFNRTTTAGVSTERAASFAVGDTLYGKIKTSTSTDHIVKTYITMTMPDGTCRYAYYDKPDFVPENDNLLFSDTKVPLYDGVWHASTDDWLWNIYEFTGGDSGIYSWNCWYEDSETGEILGGDYTEYILSTTPLLVFAITPNSRIAQIGTPVTIFMSVINAGTGNATGVSIAQASSLPATVSYQPWDGATLTGSPDTPVDIPTGEAAHFVLTINATAEFASSPMTFDVSGTNAAAAPISSVNTLTMSASAVPYADIIMMSTSLDMGMTVNIAAAFALATSNVGSAEATGVGLIVEVPSTITGLVCQVNETNPDGSIKGPAAGLTIPVGGQPTFAVFLTPTQTIDYDPANNRIVLKLVDGSGKVVGAQSVAVSAA